MSQSEHIQTISIKLNSTEAVSALQTGWLDKRRLVARKIISISNADESADILFEYIKETRPPGLKPWLQAIRAISLTATATPCIGIFLLSIFNGESINPGLALSSFLAVLFLQIAINVFNDLGDYLKLIDLPGTLGGSGVIQNGWWTPRELNVGAWTALGIGILLGAPAVLHKPAVLAPIAIIGAVGTLLYSAKRFGLKYMALGDLAVFVMCGPALTVGYSTAISSQFQTSGVLFLGCFFGFLAMGILHANNLQDIHLDHSRGVRTLAISLGFTRSMYLLVGLYLIAACALVLGVVRNALPPPTLFGLTPLFILALPWLGKIRKALGPESSLLDECRIKAAQIHLACGIATSLGITLAIVLQKVAK